MNKPFAKPSLLWSPSRASFHAPLIGRIFHFMRVLAILTLTKKGTNIPLKEHVFGQCMIRIWCRKSWYLMDNCFLFEVLIFMFKLIRCHIDYISPLLIKTPYRIYNIIMLWHSSNSSFPFRIYLYRHIHGFYRKKTHHSSFLLWCLFPLIELLFSKQK